jgi:RNA polymerase sigma factor (sigma-70 family)
MAAKNLDSLLHCVRAATLAGGEPAPTDQALLAAFVARRDEVAFEALVRRHGPLVLSACRRVLREPADVEDAFQATFLVLYRKAASIRRGESMGGWLFHVARRVALKARAAAVRREGRQARAPRRPPGAEPDADLTWREACEVLHEELDKLHEQFRLPLLLCYLQGRSRDEAARQLGLSLDTLRGRLERGRVALRGRLLRRGITLSAGLLAAAADPAAAAVPASLVRATLGVVTGAAAPAVVALARGVPLMVSGKFLLTAGSVLAAGLLVAGLSPRPTGQPGPPAARAAGVMDTPPAASRPAPPAADPAGTVRYAGRVLGPDDRPVAGAKVYYHFITRADEPIPVRATTDAQGRFSFALTDRDVPLSADATGRDPRRAGQVVAKADGFTFAWVGVAKDTAELTLRVAKDDTPLTGRVVDLEGRPLAGLRVTALSTAAPETGDLADFLKDLEAGKSYFEALRHLPNLLHNPIIGRSGVPLLPATTTGTDGRFRLDGFGHERLVELRIEGPAIETQTVYVVTRDAGRTLTPVRMKDPLLGPDPKVFVRPNGFTHPAPPGLAVAGTVRDDVSGQPISGAVVESYMLAGTKLAQNTIYRTVTDGQGRYRLNGLPRGKGNRVRFRSPADQPYLPVVKDVPPAELLRPATLDVRLLRGVWIDVRATDKATGRPVPGSVSYFVLPEQPLEHGQSHPVYGDAYDNMTAIRNDGTFRFAAVPGPAVLAFRADWDKYPIAREAATVRLPSGLSPSNFQAFAEVHPKLGDGPLTVEFALDSGRVVRGKLVGPDGSPVSGALAAGLRHDWFWSPDGHLKSDEFTALGLDPARPRLLCFSHLEKKLAGSVVVRGDEPGPITVALRPWAAVSGRLLDAEGKPVQNATLWFTEIPVGRSGRPRSLDTGLYVVDPSAYAPRRDPRTDAEGRFQVEGLVPGLKYNLAHVNTEGATELDQVKWVGLVFRDLVLTPGEAKDLGDVTRRPFPKK